MNEITLQWLPSELMSDTMKYGGKPGGIEHMLPVAEVEWWLILSVAILMFCFILLLAWVIRICQKRRADEDSITEELPVAAVQASLQALHTLDEIVYCESKEIIPWKCNHL